MSRLVTRADQIPTPETLCDWLRPRAMVNRSRDRALYDAAIRHFGSWREALTVAGINLVNVKQLKPKNLL